MDAGQVREEQSWATSAWENAQTNELTPGIRCKVPGVYAVVESDAAAVLADMGDLLFESLRKSHNLLNVAQYARDLHTSRKIVVLLPGRSAALVEWGLTHAGGTCHVLTTYGAMSTATPALAALEQYARDFGGVRIMSMAREGWTETVIACGYDVKRLILIDKLLEKKT